MMKPTAIIVPPDAPTAHTSTAQSCVIAFDLNYITDRNPILTLQLLKYYKQAARLLDTPTLTNSLQDRERAKQAMQQILAE